MIPLHERVMNNVKKIPVIKKLNNIKLLKSISRRINNHYMDNRRKLVGRYGYEMLDIIFEISSQLEIPIWIDWGTLLGFYREGKILDHDYDLDVSTWQMDEQAHNHFKRKLIDSGFELVRLFKNGDTIMTETYEYREVLVDVEYYWREDEVAYTYCFDIGEESVVTEKEGEQHIAGLNIYVYSTKCMELVSAVFSNGTHCTVPKETEKRICEEYGDTWQTPIKNHSWKDLNNYSSKGFSEEAIGWRKK